MAKVSVPQSKGDITIHAVNGLIVKDLEYKVTNGHITVEDSDLPLVLSRIEGAKEVRGTPSD